MKIYKIADISEVGQERLDAEGWHTVDSQSLGNYELYLFKAHPVVADFFSQYGVPDHQLGIQRGDTDFTDMDQQNSPNPPQNSNLPIKDTMKWVKDTIEGWKGVYGPLFAMSHSESKNRTYKAILGRLGIGYEIKPIKHPETNEDLDIIVIS